MLLRGCVIFASFLTATVFILSSLAVTNATTVPARCTPTPVGTEDECSKDFGQSGVITECQDALKGAPDYLQICTFTKQYQHVPNKAVAPTPKGQCEPVKCDHPCYIPCAYFVARNRTLNGKAKEFKLVRSVTYECKNSRGEAICGCASIALPSTRS